MDPHLLTRRTLLRGVAGLGLAATAGGVLSACGSGDEDTVAATSGIDTDAPLETTKITLMSIQNAACYGAEYVAEPFLREEGFTDIDYLRRPPGPQAITAYRDGAFDIGLGYAAAILPLIERGSPLVMLGGIHVGCWKVFATGGIKSMRQLKGRTVSIIGPEFTDGIFLAMTMAEVGLDIRKDVKVVNYPLTENARLLSSGEVDAVVAFPPATEVLQDKRIGRVILNSRTDPPWSGYYCCGAAAHGGWMKQHPVAAKRALRALLRGADSIAADPDRAAKHAVEHGHTADLKYTSEILRELPYDIWRDFDHSDSMRFYALRMKEAGLIKSNPENLIKRASDFRYISELKQEMREA